MITKKSCELEITITNVTKNIKNRNNDGSRALTDYVGLIAVHNWSIMYPSVSDCKWKVWQKQSTIKTTTLLMHYPVGVQRMTTPNPAVSIGGHIDLS